MEDENKIIVIIASSAVLILCVLIICIIIIILCRRKRANTKLPNQSSIGDKTGLGAAPPAGGIADPAYDPDKGFYENLPFHSMQNPPNKPISVIAPFNQEQTRKVTPTRPTPQNFPTAKYSTNSIQNISIKRNQSFSGFPRNLHYTCDPNTFLNVSNSQYFNYVHPNVPMKNPSRGIYSSQNFLNRPESQNTFHNSHSKSQFSNCRTLSVQNFDLNRLNLSLPNSHIRENPFSVLPSPKKRVKNTCPKGKLMIYKSESNLRTLRDESQNEKTIVFGTKKSASNKAGTGDYGTHSDSEVHSGLNDFSKKHKCYSPTFHSLRCKKHSKKRTFVYAVPKRILSDGDLPNCQDSGTSDNESIKHFHIVPIPAPRCRKHQRKEIVYQNIAEALNNNTVLDISNDDSAKLSSAEEGISTTKAEVHCSPKSTRQQKKEAETDEVDFGSSKIDHPNILSSVTNEASPRKSFASSSVDTRPKLVAVSPKKLNVSPFSSSPFKRSPTIKICSDVKSKKEIQKGALSLQIQAKIKGSSSQTSSPNPSIKSIRSDSENTKSTSLSQTKDEPKNLINSNEYSTSKDNTKKLPSSSKAITSPNKISPSSYSNSHNTTACSNDTEIPKMPNLDTSENKWEPKLVKSNVQNAFYTLTAPHQKPPSIDLAAHYSATIPHPKHTKLIPRALFQEQQLTKSKSFSSKSKQKKHFQIPLQKCHSFKFQTAESYFQPIKNLHEENLMKNGYVSDYADSNRVPRSNNKRDKHKQKTNGPLVVMRQNDYQSSLNFQENVQNSVHLQYPQPGLNSLRSHSGRPNGIVYADLDMPKAGKKVSSNNSSKPKQQKHKPKTEYATLQFNDIGQEIDV